MEVDGRGPAWSRMAAAPRPRRIDDGGRSKMLGPALCAGQVLVDACHCGTGVARQQVSSHETHRMTTRILSVSETVDTLDDVLTAEIGVVSGHAFAFDNCMRVMFIVFLANVLKEDRDVRSSVRRQNRSARPRLGSRQYSEISTPITGHLRQRLSHAGPKAFRYGYLARPGMRVWRGHNPCPARKENLQNRVAAFTLDVNVLPPTNAMSPRNFVFHVVWLP